MKLIHIKNNPLGKQNHYLSIVTYNSDIDIELIHIDRHGVNGTRRDLIKLFFINNEVFKQASSKIQAEYRRVKRQDGVLTHLDRIQTYYQLLITDPTFNQKLINEIDLNKFFSSLRSIIIKDGYPYAIKYIKFARHSVLCFLANYREGRIYRVTGDPRVGFRSGGIPRIIPGRLAQGLRCKETSSVKLCMSLLFIFRHIPDPYPDIKPDMAPILDGGKITISQDFKDFIKTTIKERSWKIGEIPEPEPIMCNRNGPYGHNLLFADYSLNQTPQRMKDL